jgi:predicted nucleic acid-binding protein
MRYQEDAMNRQATSIIRSVSTNEDGEIVQNGVIYDVQLELSQGMREFETVLLDAVNTDTVLNDHVIRLIALKSAVENYETPREQRRNERRAAGETDE